MRKVVAFSHVTLDGYACGPQGELEWANVEDQISDDVSARLEGVGAAVYGRVTYGMMAGYWPAVPGNPDSTERELRHAHWVNAVPKVVVSRSLEEADWDNTSIIRENVTEEVGTLKAQSGGDLMIFGSPHLIHLFARLGLVDEYLLYVNPVTLGSGVPVFEAGTHAKLHLLETKAFEAGVVVMRYEVARG